MDKDREGVNNLVKRIAIGIILGALLLTLAVGTGIAKQGGAVIQAIVQCETTDPVCMGGDGPDEIFGTNEDDEIWAGGGNDKVFASDGEDTVFGQSGNDLVGGEDDNDPRLEGNAGDDDVYGFFGNDTLSGNAGNDALTGEEGVDIQAGGDNADTIDAARFESADGDSIFGGPGPDTIDATDGFEDTIQCGSGKDTVFFDPNEDTVAADCENKIGQNPSLSQQNAINDAFDLV